MAIEESFIDRLELDISTEKLEGISDALGPNGKGSFLLPDVLNNEQIAFMREEIFDPSRVVLRDNHHKGPHDRHGELIENHTVFALKLLQGDQTLVEHVPRMRALATNIERFIVGLSVYFPALVDYEADEMSLHRYDDQAVGLSFHRDNSRFFGLVAIATIEGARDFQTLDDNGAIETTSVSEGDLHLTRVNGLYRPSPRVPNICPDHAVVNLKTPYSTSFIVRANSRPDDPIPGFTYDNWGPVNPRYKKD